MEAHPHPKSDKAEKIGERLAYVIAAIVSIALLLNRCGLI